MKNVLRQIIAVLAGAGVWYGIECLMIPILSFWSIVIAPFVSGFIAASIAKKPNFVIAVIAVLGISVPMTIWGYITDRPIEGITLGSHVAGFIFSMVYSTGMAVAGAFLSNLIFKNKPAN